ncbi:transcriptional regulator, LysR family [Pseudoxanthomonas sp. GM95]|uniref:LysR family transcriptional regulator n=1 Tax=Pseudoxanthomonas sp. GM95 TaxID=1881043 RepID=UPI0008D6DE32|nr:LysR family transcriptional regulator [Pseudoxanthomonas sp. GM95]SEM60125.1 transcriptional regulator, LysR family [Pseudoxanthomonas sp. GM95]
MDLRHLRCFLAVAQELHFARAAERLHIEQSPLSRTIKELEEDLGVQLFIRTTRSTRLTRAGQLFLQHTPRIFIAVQQARESARAAARGFHDQLRVALSDGMPPAIFANFLAQCRLEEPEVDVRLHRAALAQQVKGLVEDLYDVGFAGSGDVGEQLVADPVWHDPLMVAVPSRHPLLSFKAVPLEELLRYPLVLPDLEVFEGYAQQIDRVLRRIDCEPIVAERVGSIDLMMALVAAGFALALLGSNQFATARESGVIARPLGERSPVLTTYLLRRADHGQDTLRSFLARTGLGVSEAGPSDGRGS